MMNVKTKLKNRLISGLLAFAMVLSLLPAGLIQRAEAFEFPTGSLNINSDGSFSAVFTAASNIPATGIGGHYFVLIPNIKVGDAVYTPEEAIRASEITPSSAQTVSDLEGLLNYWCGFDFSENVPGYITLGNNAGKAAIPASAYPATGNTLTVNQNTNNVGKLSPIDDITGHFGSIAVTEGIPYIAIVFSAAGSTPHISYTTSYYAASGLVADSVDVVYSENVTDWDAQEGEFTWEVNNVDMGEDRTFIRISIRNTGGSAVQISNIKFLSGSGIADNSQGPLAMGFSVNEDTFQVVPHSFNNADRNAIEDAEIENYTSGAVTVGTGVNDTIELTIDLYDSAFKLVTGDSGKGTLRVTYLDGTTPRNLDVPVSMTLLSDYRGTATVTLKLDGSNWTTVHDSKPTITLLDASGSISASGTSANGGVFTFADLKEGTYSVIANGNVNTGKTVIIAESNPSAANTTVDYYTYEITAGTGGTVADKSTPSPRSNGIYITGTSIRPTATPNPGYSFTGWTGTHTTAPTTLTARTVIQANFAASGVTVQVNLDGTGDSSYNVRLYKQTSTNTWNNATAPTKNATGLSTFTAVPNDTYNIYVNNVDTGKTITVNNNTPSETINYYTVKVAANPAAGGSVWIGNSATDNGVTTLVVLGGTNVQINAAANGGYNFTGWTGTAALSNLTETISNVNSGPRTYTANFGSSSVTIQVNLDGSGDTAGKMWQFTDSAGKTWTGTTDSSNKGTFTLSAVPTGSYTVQTKRNASETTWMNAGTLSVTATGGSATVNYYTYTLTAGTGGTASDGGGLANGQYLSGTAIAPTATASAGYKFTGWTGTHTTAPSSLTARTVIQANFTPAGITWDAQPNNQTKTYGDTLVDMFWRAKATDEANNNYPITYTVTVASALTNKVTTATVTTTALGVGGYTLSNVASQLVAAGGPYDVTVTATDCVSTITSTRTITVNKKKLPNPVLTFKSNVTTAGAANGVVTYTAPTEAYPSVVTLTFIDASGNVVSGKTVPTATGDITGLAPGTYRVRGTLSDTANYEWTTPVSGNTASGDSSPVPITEPGVTRPTLTGSYTFEKNSTVRTTTGASYTFTTGNWNTVSSVRIGTTTLNSGDYTASGGTITISDTVLAGLNLPNGSYTVQAKFSDSNGYQTETDWIGTATLAVKTTYTVTFDPNGGTGTATIGNAETTTATSVPSFSSSNIKTPPTRSGYILAGWSTNGNDNTVDWGSTPNPTTYTPAGPSASLDLMDSTKWNTTVYAVWTANVVKVTTKLNGAVVSGRKITLYNGTTATAFTGTTDASGVVTFTAVPVGTYNIYDELTAGSPKSTGVTVVSAAGNQGTGTSAAEVRYYDVNFLDVTSATDHGIYTGVTSPAVPTSGNIIINSSLADRRKVDPLPKTTPDTNYTHSSWTLTPSSGVGTAPGATATEWTATQSTTYNATGAITLKPVFTKDRANLTVTVNRNGSLVTPDSIRIDVTGPSSYSQNKTTTTGSAVFDSLTSGDYTANVNGWTTSSSSTKTTRITAPTDGSITLNYYDYHFNANKPAEATGTVSGMPTLEPTATAPVLTGYTVTQPSNPSLPGYTFLGWATSANATSAAAWSGTSGINTITSEKTFYAVWRAETPTLTEMNAYGALNVEGIRGFTANKASATNHNSDTDFTYEVWNGTAWATTATQDGITLNGGTTLAFTAASAPTKVGTVAQPVTTSVFRVRAVSTLNGLKSAADNAASSATPVTVTIQPTYTVVYDKNTGGNDSQVPGAVPTDGNLYVVTQGTQSFTGATGKNGETVVANTITASSARLTWTGGVRTHQGWASSTTGGTANTFTVATVANASNQNKVPGSALTLYAIWQGKDLAFNSKELSADYNMSGDQWKADARFYTAGQTPDLNLADGIYLPSLVSNGSADTNLTFSVTDIPSFMEYVEATKTLKLKANTRIGNVAVYTINITVSDAGNMTGGNAATAPGTIKLTVNKTTPLIWKANNDPGLNVTGGPTFYTNDLVWDHTGYYQVVDPYENTAVDSSVTITKVLSYGTNKATDAARWQNKVSSASTWTARTQTIQTGNNIVYNYRYTHAGSDASNYNVAEANLTLTGVARSISLQVIDDNRTNPAPAWAQDYVNSQTPTYDPTAVWQKVQVSIRLPATANADIQKLFWTQNNGAGDTAFRNITLVQADGTTARNAPDTLAKGDTGEYILTFEVNIKASGTHTLKYTFTGESGIKPGATSLSNASATPTGDRLGSYRSVSATYTYTTVAQANRLEKPDPDLSRIEVNDGLENPDGSNDDATIDYTGLDFKDQDGTKLDEKLGGLHLVFKPIPQDTAGDVAANAVKEYKITVTGGGKTLTATITPDKKDTDNNYHYYWPANLTNGPVPGTPYKVEVQAISRNTALYTDSEIGDDTVTNPDGNGGAGWRELTVDMMEANTKFTDRVFNGLAQNGGGGYRLKTTYPSGIGTVSINYDNGDGTSKTTTKVNVNLSNNKDPKPSNGTNPDHDYDIYLAVTRGTLYLPLASTKWTGNDTNTVDANIPNVSKITTDDNIKNVNKGRGTTHADWEIVQAPAALKFTNGGGTDKNTFSGQTMTPKDITPGVYVEYTSGNGAQYNDGNKRITQYYDIVYEVVSSPSSTNYPAGKVLTASDLASFKADAPGLYIFRATAKYKTEDFPNGMTEAEYNQFKADISEATNTFTFSTQARTVTSIVLERYEAVNGTTGAAGVDTGANLTDNRAVTYGTAVNVADWAGIGYYAATDRNAAKQMRMEGLRITVNWSGGDPDVYIVGAPENLPDGAKPLPTGANWNSSATAIANAPALNDLFLTFKNADAQTNLSFSYGGKTSNTVTFRMARRPIDYKVVSDDEKVWNNSAVVTGHIEFELPENLTGDDVKIAVFKNTSGNEEYQTTANKYDPTKTYGPNEGYTTTNNNNVPSNANRNVGKDKEVRAVTQYTSGHGSDVTGADKNFYKRGRETPGKATIKPSLVTRVNVTLNEPSASTVNNWNQLSNTRYNPNTNDRADEKGIGTGNWSLPVISKTWEAWDDKANDGAGGWVPVTDIFKIDTVYRATVTVRADTNHYAAERVIDKYTMNGKGNGEVCFEDLDEWNVGDKKDMNVVTVTVDETGRFHSDWPDNGDKVWDKDDGEVLYNNTITFTYLFHTFETPTLQFSDELASWDDENPNPRTGTDHTPGQYVHHDEILQAGAPGMTYLIAVNASVKDIFGGQVILTNKELLEAGAELRIVQGNGNINTALPVNQAQETPMYKIGSADFKADQDLIIYELTIPSSLTAAAGLYHLEFQAMGSTSLENLRAGKIDVAKSYYTFTLEVLDPPQIAGETPLPMVTYWLGNNGYTNDMTSEKMASIGARPTFTPEVVALNRYTFKGWTLTDPTTLKPGEEPELVDPLRMSISEDTIFYAYYDKDEVDHIHYVGGYPDGSFRPDMPITRAEVATIIARSCLDGFVEGSDYGNPGEYSDIGTKRWYTSAISYCSMAGVFGGYPDGTFRPNQYITRQELALVVGRLAGLRVNMGLPFEDATDVNKWARDGVYTCYILGYVGGYNDGTFRPKNDITRAETVKIFNGYLNRGVDAKGLEGMTPFVLDTNAGGYNNTNNEYLTWSDVAEKHWAYYEIIEASNDHDYRWPDDTKEYPPEDWDTAYIDAEWRYRATYAMYWNISEGTILDPITSVKMGETPKAPVVTPDEGRILMGWALEEGGEIVDIGSITVEGAMNFYGIFGNEGDELPRQKFTVTYLAGEQGDWTNEQGDLLVEGTERVEEGKAPAAPPEVIAHEGYEFLGWSLTEGGIPMDVATIIITGETTLYAVYKESEADHTHIVTYIAGEYGDLLGEAEETVEIGATPVAIPVVTAHEGYEFLGWSLTENGPVVSVGGIRINTDLTFYAVYEEKVPEFFTHYAFMEGFEDGNFYPSEAITRATVADMVARTYGSDFDPSYAYDVSAFADIPANYWAANAIGYCVEKGIFGGYPDGTFLPEGNMTRQEFSVVIAKMAGVQTNQGLPFTDADSINKWARDYVYTVYVNGWIGGYKDGSFQPKALITRAEAVKIFCGFLGRNVTKASVTEGIDLAETWTDVGYKNWAYAFIMEATNTHTYYLDENGEEVWVSTQPSDRAPMKLPSPEEPEPVVTPEPVTDPEPVTGPEDPENPGETPENPENPENPGENPENPDENPENPGEDQNPENPENPGEDQNPENPENLDENQENPENLDENQENPENPDENQENPENPETPTEPEAIGTGFVNTSSRLNVRPEPNTENQPIAILDFNARVEILEDMGEWYQIRFRTGEGETLTGYVMAQYITRDE